MPFAALLTIAALFSFAAMPVSTQPAPAADATLAEARAHVERDDFEAARRVATQVRADAEAAGNVLLAAEATRIVGQSWLEQERFAEARTELLRARDDFARAGADRQRVETSILLARVQGYLGQLADPAATVLPLLEEIDRLDLPRVARLNAYSQGLYAIRGTTAQSGVLARALSLLEPDDAFVTACVLWQAAGDESFNAARYVEAHERLTRALTCFEGIGQDGDAGRVLVSLGRVQRAHGQLDAAMEYYVRAADMQKAAGDIPAWLQSLNAQAVTWDRLGQFARAEALYREALSVARERSLTRYEMFLQGNLGGSFLQAGRTREGLREIEAIVDREHSLVVKAIRHRQIASAYLDLDEPERAAPHLDLAQSIDPEASFDNRIGWLNEHAWLLALQNDLAGAQRDLDEAVRRIEEARAGVLASDQARSGFGDLHQNIFAASIEVAMRRGDAGGALELAEQARARALLDLQAGDDLEKAQPPRVAAMQALARQLRTTFLVYWVGRSSTFGWVVTPTSIHGQRLAINERGIRALVRSAAGGGDVPGAVNGALIAGPDLRPWRDLYTALVAPLESHLPRTPAARLTVVPHGPILHLPFAGLLDTRGRHIVERYVLHYTPSIAVLSRTAERPAPQGPTRALVIGDPSPLPSLAGVQLPPPLPLARDEAHRVSRHFPGRVQLALGADATEGAVRSALRDHGLVHMAAHARVAEETTAQSYLLLARGSGGSDDDGLLTAEEVADLRLDGATVVLSACGTALGRVTGEGTLGFTRSFLAAGARAVVATTWEMPDVTGSPLMDALYGALPRHGVAAALREAQLRQLRALRAGRATMRVGSDRVALPATPLLWAGYVAVGAPD